MPTYRSPRQDAPDLQNYGPRFLVEIGLPITKAGGAQNTAKLSGLIDTGSSRTVVVPKEVYKLGLPEVDRTKLSRVGGTTFATVHVASVQFPNSNLTTIQIMQIVCCELPEQPADCLIGRDILRRWLFTYDGKLGAWAIDEETRAPWIEPQPEGLWC